MNVRQLMIVWILAIAIIGCAGYSGPRTGVRLMEVVPYSPADDARFAAGDYIVEVSQTPVSSADQIHAIFETAKKSGRESVLVLVESANGKLRFVAVNATIGLQGMKFLDRQ
ncbi:MAG: hypothetical protein ACREF9_13225 [Opitutaceae bacterium]